MSSTDQPSPPPQPGPDAAKHTMEYTITPPVGTPSGTLVFTDAQGNEYVLEADASKHTMVLKI